MSRTTTLYCKQLHSSSLPKVSRDFLPNLHTSCRRETTILLASRSARCHSLEVRLLDTPKVRCGLQPCHPLNLSRTGGFAPALTPAADAPQRSTRGRMAFSKPGHFTSPRQHKPHDSQLPWHWSRLAREPTSISPGYSCCFSRRPLATRQAVIKGQVSTVQQTSSAFQCLSIQLELLGPAFQKGIHHKSHSSSCENSYTSYRVVVKNGPEYLLTEMLPLMKAK